MRIAALACLPMSLLGAEQCLGQVPPPCQKLSTSKCGPINLAISNPAGGANLPILGDAVWGLTNCTVIANSPTVTCPSASYTTPPAGYQAKLIADDAGSSSGARVPYIGTITAATSAGGILTLTLNSTSLPAFGAGGSTIVAHSTEILASTPGAGYAFGSTQTLICPASICSTSDGHIDAKGTPGIMTAETVQIAAFGSTSLTSTTCTLVPLQQAGISGAVSNFIGTLSAGGTLTMVSIAPGGGGRVIGDRSPVTSVSANVLYYTDLVSGCGFPSSGPGTAAVKIGYGILVEQMTPGTGVYVYNSTTTNPCTAPLPTIAYVGGTTIAGTNFTAFCAGTQTIGTTTTALPTFKGAVSFGTDNTTELQAAIGVPGSPATGTMNYGAANGQPECLYIPAGNYLTEPLNFSSTGTLDMLGNYYAQGYGCWIGDEHLHTNIFVIPNKTGDVFAWNESAPRQSLPDLGNTLLLGNATNSPTGANQAGSGFHDMNIVGDRLSTSSQNALAYYGKNSFAYINNVTVSYMAGHGFYAGGPDTNSVNVGQIQESVFSNLRLDHDGALRVPAIEITSNSTAAPKMGPQGSNDLFFNNISIHQPLGGGILIHNTGSGVSLNTSGMLLVNVAIDGSGASFTNAGDDLLRFGDLTPPGTLNVSAVVGQNIHLINPPLGHAALRIAGPNSGITNTYEIDGSIEYNPAVNNNAPDFGRGVQVDACNLCKVELAHNNSQDYNLMVGSTVSGTICSGAHLGADGLSYITNIGTVIPSSIVTNCIQTLTPVFVRDFGSFH